MNSASTVHLRFDGCFDSRKKICMKPVEITNKCSVSNCRYPGIDIVEKIAKWPALYNTNGSICINEKSKQQLSICCFYEK